MVGKSSTSLSGWGEGRRKEFDSRVRPIIITAVNRLLNDSPLIITATVQKQLTLHARQASVSCRRTAVAEFIGNLCRVAGNTV